MLSAITHDSMTIFKEQTMTAQFGSLSLAAQVR